MVIPFCPVFLPTLGDAAEQKATAFDEGINPPLFAELIADSRFAELRLCLQAAPSTPPIETAAPAPRGNHPVAIVLSQPGQDEQDVESTAILPIIEASEPELWLPDISGPAHVRQHG